MATLTIRGTRASRRSMWVFCGGAGGVLTLLMGMAFLQRWYSEPGSRPSAVASLAVATLCLALAVRSKVQLRRFGGSWLELEAPPFLGGAVRGVLKANANIVAASEVLVTLECEERWTTWTSGVQFHSRSLWRQEGSLPTSALSRVPEGVRLTIAFPLPRAEDVPTSSDSTHWILTVRAKLPGLDFCEEFPIPVIAAARA